jgi:hypothetical protein
MLTDTSYSFSYTNTTDASVDITPKAIGVVTNYAKVMDEPQEARISNKTASLEQPELVTYKSRRANKVDTLNKVKYPAPVQSGVVYQVRVDSILRGTTGDIKVDEPCAMWLTIAHPASEAWTNDRVAGVLKRLLGACTKSDGSYRFEDLMRSALVPTQD